MKEHLWWIVAVLASIALLVGLVMVGGRGPAAPDIGNEDTRPRAAGTLSEPAHDADHSKGPADAAVTLIEYSDFQCPACAAYQPLIERLTKEFPNDVRFVYRHFPLRSIHANAQLAAQSTEAADKQGKFWEMHDALFSTQREWSVISNPKNFFVELAESIDLDRNQFENDLDSADAIQAINDDFNHGTRSNVQGTPSLYLNGQKINNPSSYEALRDLVQDEINRANGQG